MSEARTAMLPVPRRAPLRPFPLLLAAFCLALAAWPWLMPRTDLPASIKTPLAEAPVALPLPPLDSLRQTVQRPLFESLRQPAAKPAMAPPQDGAPLVLGRYRLLGIVGSGGRRSALLAPLAGGASRLLAAGDMLEDWRITQVGEADLTLMRGSESQTVALRHAR